MTTHLKPILIRKTASRRYRTLSKVIRSWQQQKGDIASLNTAVHEARRELKKLRALVRLIRPQLGRAAYQQNNARLREASRLLAPLRDDWVRIELVRSMANELATAGDQAATVFQEAEARLQAHFQASLKERKPKKLFKRLNLRLGFIRKQIDQWPVAKQTELASHLPSLQRSYQQMQTLYARSLRNPSVENLHEWRKQAKYLRYQLEFFQKGSSSVIGEFAQSLHQLTDFLGDDHDLAVLRQTLESQESYGMRFEELVALHEFLENRHRDRVDSAHSLGLVICSSSPDEFAHQLASAVGF